MIKILSFLKGKKSYLLAALVVCYGLYKHFFGEHLSWDATVDYVFSGTGLAVIRAAISKIPFVSK